MDEEEFLRCVRLTAQRMNVTEASVIADIEACIQKSFGDEMLCGESIPTAYEYIAYLSELVLLEIQSK